MNKVEEILADEKFSTLKEFSTILKNISEVTDIQTLTIMDLINAIIYVLELEE